jgi:hypothetical protein
MESIKPIRAYVVVHSITRERVSHEMTTEADALAFVESIRHAEGDDFEVVPVG